MQQFQIEWHNLSSTGRIKMNESGYLPDVVKHNEELSEKLKLLESEVDRYRKSAEYIIKYFQLIENIFIDFIIVSSN